MISIRSQNTHAAEHLEERFKGRYAYFVVSEQSVEVLYFKGNTRGYSWRVYKDIILLPRFLDILEIGLALCFILVLSEHLNALLGHHVCKNTVNRLRHLSNTTRNNHFIAFLHTGY